MILKLLLCLDAKLYKIVQKYTKRDELGKIPTSAVRGPINDVF